MQGGAAEEGAVRNFVAGLLLGVLATYWYLVQMPYTRALIAELWERASEPPAIRAAPKAGAAR